MHFMFLKFKTSNILFAVTFCDTSLDALKRLLKKYMLQFLFDLFHFSHFRVSGFDVTRTISNASGHL